MESYQIEGIEPEQLRQLATLLQSFGWDAGLEGLFWLPLDPEDLSPLQKEHAATCGPYALALEVEARSLNLEFLVRARNSLRCACIHPASPALETKMRQRLDSLLAQAALCAAPAVASDLPDVPGQPAQCRPA